MAAELARMSHPFANVTTGAASRRRSRHRADLTSSPEKRRRSDWCLLCGLTMAALLSWPATARAQAELAAALIPTELSLGLGAALDWRPRQSDVAVNFGLARPPSLGLDPKRDQWIEPALEIGLAPTSDEAPCQAEGPLAAPETCADFYVLTGPRFRPLRESLRLWRPFIHLLVGGYWKGTGLKDPETLPATFALQTGGGVDLRRPTSIHGVRFSGDYRRVFANGDGRHQVQLLVSYFVGWRGKPRE